MRTKYFPLSYLPCIKCFGLPISVSCPVYGNVKDDESLPLVSVSKGCTSLLSVQSDVHMNQKRREEFNNNNNNNERISRALFHVKQAQLRLTGANTKIEEACT